MDPNIDAKQATDKAVEFLREYHTTCELISAALDNDVWLIILDVGFLSKQAVEVKIHANSGKILGYVHVHSN